MPRRRLHPTRLARLAHVAPAVARACGCGVLLLALASGRCASADDAVVVLDRGVAAKEGARRHERDALRLVETLVARGHDARLALYGTRPDGRIRAARLSGDLQDRLGRAAAKEGWRYEGPTDPRHALGAALEGRDGAGSLLVVLVGPFGTGEAGGADAEDGADDDGDAEEGDGDRAAPGAAEAREALARWEETAPQGTRVFAPDLSPEGLALVAGARGVVTGGAIVLAAWEAVTEPEPWSPLAVPGPEAALRAALDVPLEVLLVGTGPAAPLLEASSSDGRGELTPAGPPAGSVASTAGSADAREAPPAPEEARRRTLHFALRRPWQAGSDAARVETVAFTPAEDASVLWLADTPGPRTVQWTTLRPDARTTWLLAGEGVAPTRLETDRPLDADPLLVGRPLVRTCRIEHTRVGEPPVWRVRAAEGDLFEGLGVDAGDVVNLTDEIAVRELDVRLEARPGEPGAFEGTLVIEAASHPRRFEVPYRAVVPPGRVVARLEAPEEAQRLPAGADAPAWSLVVDEERPNAPPLVRVEAVLDPPDLATTLTARLRGGGGVDVAWDLGRPLEVRPGRRYALEIDLAPGVREAQGTLALRLPVQPGVVGRAEGLGRIASRSPRLVVASGEGSYRMDDGEVVADTPLVVEVDADGGGGAWRLALLGATPTVTVPPDAPIGFALRAEGPGRWALVPEGAWRGARGDTFAARTETVPVTLHWPAGPAPGRIEVAVDVRPRWGTVGWILVGLAVLALALGTWSLLQMRAAPLEGTLLYQVEGREGAVGRLDLGPAGRRTTTVRADRVGRLGLTAPGGNDREAVVVIRATRVGGLLEIPGSQPPERHLLVDGLTVTTGRHRIRYVSARPGDGSVPAVSGPEEELLGPEFDLPTGRIDALGRSSPGGSTAGASEDAGPVDSAGGAPTV